MNIIKLNNFNILLIYLNMYTILRRFVNKSFTPILSKKYSLPAYEPVSNNRYYIDNIHESICLDHGYVCPLCNGAGIIPCKLCKEGCLYCGYSEFILCRCQLDL